MSTDCWFSTFSNLGWNYLDLKIEAAKLDSHKVGPETENVFQQALKMEHVAAGTLSETTHGPIMTCIDEVSQHCRRGTQMQNIERCLVHESWVRSTKYFISYFCLICCCQTGLSISGAFDGENFELRGD